MGLLVKHLSGPYAGREIELAEGLTEIRFGRDAGAEIGFPAELDVVGRDHFRLRREVGTWKFVIAKQRPLFAGGRALIDGEELDAPVELELSGPGGPRLKIESRAGVAGNLPKTRVLASGQDIGDVVELSHRRSRRLALWLAGVSLALAAVAGGVFLLRGDLMRVAGQVPALEAKIADAAAAAAHGIDSAAILTRVRPSVYLVALRTPGGTVEGIGTASVVRLPDGSKALATNAHISVPVAKYLEGKAGVTPIAIQPLGPEYRQVTIVGAKTHPAYLEFEAWAKRLAALREESRVRDVKIMPSGYDVGLLFVADPEQLGEPLEIAGPAALAALDSGTPLVMTGYPMMELAGTDPERPEPNAHIGIITAATTFYLFRGAPGDNLLLQHSLPTAGGASGSPMFNADGKVVAYHNATNAPRGFPTPSMINYAQRADLLLELMDGSAEGKMPAYRAEWAAVQDRLTKSDPDAILNDLVNGFMQEMGGPASEIRNETVEMSAPTGDGPHALVGLAQLALEPGAAYLVVADSADKRPIMLNGFAGETWVTGSAGGYFISSLKIGNDDGRYKDITIGALDETSLGETPVTPGRITLRVWKVTTR